MRRAGRALERMSRCAVAAGALRRMWRKAPSLPATAGDRLPGHHLRSRASSACVSERCHRGNAAWRVKSGNVPLPGVTVTAQNTLTGKRYSTTTDITGAWSYDHSAEWALRDSHPVRCFRAGLAGGVAECDRVMIRR